MAYVKQCGDACHIEQAQTLASTSAFLEDSSQGENENHEDFEEPHFPSC